MGGLRSTTRRRRYVTVAVAAAVISVCVPAPAHAGQPDASKEPRVSGPLEVQSQDCLPHQVKYGGKTIALLNACVWLYEFDLTMETDALRNYGVAWVQTTVDATNGWCATKVNSEVSLPQDVQRHGYAPRRKLARRKPARATVKLKVDAEGYAVEDAAISQRFNLFPKTWRPTLADNGRSVITTWTGRESSKLAFAHGVEFSWPLGQSPGIVRGGLGHMRFVKSRGC